MADVSTQAVNSQAPFQGFVQGAPSTVLPAVPTPSPSTVGPTKPAPAVITPAKALAKVNDAKNTLDTVTPQIAAPKPPVQTAQTQNPYGPGFDQNGTAIPTTTSTTNTSTDTGSLLDKYNASIEANNIKSDAAYKSYSDSIAKLQNGTFPLTPDQQAQVNALQASIDRSAAAQKLANQNYTGGVTMAGVREGISRYSPQLAQGEIKQSIDQGIAKINDLETQGAAAIAKLREGFQTNNLALIKDSYDAFNNYMKDKNATLTEMYKNVDAHEKDIRDFNQSIQDKKDALNEQMAKNGAPQSVIDAVNGASSVSQAISAGWQYMSDPTSLGGQYNAYVRGIEPGKTPMSPADFVAAQKYADALATEKASAAYAYQKAYDAAQAKAVVDAANTGSNKVQQKLEKDYSTTLLKELSNRSGGLGLQDQKVNQAIHLKSLIDQYTTTDSKGNKVYNIPTAQYSELVLGLANLLSGQGAASESTRNDLMSMTAKGDINKALQYLTGVPQNGNTQAVIKNLVDSIDRQGTVAEQLRDQDVQILRGLAPTDLEDSRKSALEKNLLPSFINPTQNIVQAKQQAETALQAYTIQHPEKAADMAKAEQALQKQLGLTEVPATTFLQYFPEFGGGFSKPLSEGGNSSVSKIADAIGQFESGGNYKAVGPDTGNGDRAIGKYQVMASNVPSWTKEALGKSMTPDEFKNDPEAQDKVAQYKMAQYYNQYGTVEDVASAWFSGRPLAKAGNAKDVIGTSVPSYVKNVKNIYDNLG